MTHIQYTEETPLGAVHTVTTSPLVQKYAGLKPVQTERHRILHGNSTIVKERYAAVHDALRGSAG